MKPALIAAGFALALAAHASAAPAPTWTVQPGSRLGFRASFGGQAFEGTFHAWSAKIAFDAKNLAGSQASVSVDTASAVTGDPDRDSALPTTDWFDAHGFPKAVFTTRAIRDLGGGRYAADGTLSLRGVSRPVSLPFTLKITGDTAVMSGQAVIDRNVFGVGQGQWRATDTLAGPVTVLVSITARRSP
jgi:polyisoprenoid-binding protein YceI